MRWENRVRLDGEITMHSQSQDSDPYSQISNLDEIVYTQSLMESSQEGEQSEMMWNSQGSVTYIEPDGMINRIHSDNVREENLTHKLRGLQQVQPERDDILKDLTLREFIQVSLRPTEMATDSQSTVSNEEVDRLPPSTVHKVLDLVSMNWEFDAKDGLHLYCCHPCSLLEDSFLYTENIHTLVLRDLILHKLPLPFALGKLYLHRVNITGGKFKIPDLVRTLVIHNSKIFPSTIRIPESVQRMGLNNMPIDNLRFEPLGVVNFVELKFLNHLKTIRLPSHIEHLTMMFLPVLETLEGRIEAGIDMCNIHIGSVNAFDIPDFDFKRREIRLLYKLQEEEEEIDDEDEFVKWGRQVLRSALDINEQILYTQSGKQNDKK